MDHRLRNLADQIRRTRRAADFDPAAIEASLLPHLFVLEIEQGGSAPRLKIRLTGTALDEAFQRKLAGRYLEEFIHGPRAADVIDGFHRCATTHESVWMRQVVRIRDKHPRFVEGIAIFLEPDRIYGGLLVGELPTDVDEGSFETHPIY